MSRKDYEKLYKYMKRDYDALFEAYVSVEKTLSALFKCDLPRVLHTLPHRAEMLRAAIVDMRIKLTKDGLSKGDEAMSFNTLGELQQVQKMIETMSSQRARGDE